MKTSVLVVLITFLLFLGAPDTSIAAVRFRLNIDGCEIPKYATVKVEFPEGWLVPAKRVEPKVWTAELSFPPHHAVDPDETDLTVKAPGFKLTEDREWREDAGDWGTYFFRCTRIVDLEVGSQPGPGVEFYYEVLGTDTKGTAWTLQPLEGVLRDAKLYLRVERHRDGRGCRIIDRTVPLGKSGDFVKVPLDIEAVLCLLPPEERRKLGRGVSDLERELAAHEWGVKELWVEVDP